MLAEFFDRQKKTTGTTVRSLHSTVPHSLYAGIQHLNPIIKSGSSTFGDLIHLRSPSSPLPNLIALFVEPTQYRRLTNLRCVLVYTEIFKCRSSDLHVMFRVESALWLSQERIYVTVGIKL